ncbi:dihydroorotate dehydrogenase electron transfer subunit [candidate division TA06 bacterium]|uniref:Dihydroorotate dehydrogenase B (NAD(+)), electron transfer subunit n=1 Tax=candidate division TA06 bacterium TaxID=2250710 RepID=A0A523UTY5_UNCT6|nr:MAG: dihydroorotate dehydrogenase electron transfer subunit [candidate division TA06 bacterium]
MNQEKGKVLENERLCEDVYRIRIRSPRISKEVKAGQFVMLRITEGFDPLLLRPFSFHDVQSESYELVYQVVGRGTSILSKKSIGDVMDSIGPLGNGFESAQGEAILVAGGIGIAPLFLLARSLTGQKMKTVLVYGAKTASSLVCRERFDSLGVSVKLATEDGSAGFKGTCVGLLEPLLGSSAVEAVYACGPAAMLREVAKLCKGHDISCQMSVEERMACGVGACKGCSITRTDGGYLTVCEDGPVFDAGKVKI